MYRSPGATMLWWGWVVLAVLALGDLVVQGGGRTAAVGAAVVVAVTGVLYACALRPRVVAGPAGITLANPLRDHQVPWGAVDKVDVVNSLRVHCAPRPGASRGRVIHSWALQSSPTSALRKQAAAQRAQRREMRRSGYGRGGTRPDGTGRPGSAAGYGHAPAEVRDALERAGASFVAAQLDERAARERQAGAAAGDPQVRWSWEAIAAIMIPVLAIVIAALA